MLFKDDLQLLNDAPEAQLSLGRRCLSYCKRFNSLRALMIRMTARVSNDHHCKPELFSVLSVEILARISVPVDYSHSWEYDSCPDSHEILGWCLPDPKVRYFVASACYGTPIWSQLNLVYTPIFHVSTIHFNNILPHKAGSLRWSRNIVGSIPDGVMEIFH